MGYPYDVGEHDIPPGVTVCFVKDLRDGSIVHDGLHIDDAENLAEMMNENHASEEAAREFDCDDE